MSNYGLQTLFPKPKDLLQNQKENQRLTQTFSNSGRWLWISVTGCFRSANGTLLKLSSLPLQVERHLSSHWLSPWGSEVKHVLGLHGSKDTFTLIGLEGSSLSSPRVDMRGTPCRDRNFLSMATILGDMVIGQKWAIVTWDGCSVQRLGEECFPIGLQHPGQPVG